MQTRRIPARLLFPFLALAMVASIHAVPAAATPDDFAPTAAPKAPNVPYEGGGRTGGDTLFDATEIRVLPFFDSGNTCGYIDDYDEVCPYTGSPSPDVVYSYVPAHPMTISVDLCESLYDTKVYIYADGPHEVIACNDDAGCGYSGWQSQIDAVSLEPGRTYYIVVDGYGGECGDYELEVYEWFGGCPAWYCPPGSLEENEPECYDGYDDFYNGGCNTEGWTPIWAQTEGYARVCGESGTYLYQGSNYRDTDWFTAVAAGGPVEMVCCATFPLQIILIWGTDCQNLEYDLATAGVLEEVTLVHDVPAGAEVWLWVGASGFSGVPCGSQYVLEVTGIEPESPVPIEERSWGSVKRTFAPSPSQ